MPRSWFLVTLANGEPLAFFPTLGDAERLMRVEFWQTYGDSYATLDGRYAGREVSQGELLAILFPGAAAGAVA